MSFDPSLACGHQLIYSRFPRHFISFIFLSLLLLLLLNSHANEKVEGGTVLFFSRLTKQVRGICKSEASILIAYSVLDTASLLNIRYFVDSDINEDEFDEADASSNLKTSC